MSYKGDILYIEQVLKGRIDAYASIVEHHSTRVFNLAFRICGNREDAEEIAQDAFLKAYRSLSSFKMKSSFSTWLYRIVYNTAISYMRLKKKGILSLEEFPVEAIDFRHENLTEDEAEKEYRNSVVNFALQKISEEERGLISLFYYEELSNVEISVITGFPKSTVKVKLFRARQKMQQIIEKTEKKKTIFQ
ncbi:MAG TPA: RNA polymerase sigma factor [Bacteroidales bacterium]|nr:RNA polymerase sigma factor [Bacteroidales bacterium]